MELRVAMIGSRGVPARWGGVERHVEELGAELVRRGHRVTVFCRSNYSGGERPREHRGMRLAHLPTVGTKHLDAIVYRDLERHYRDRLCRTAVYVPNGAPATADCPPPGQVLGQLGLDPGRYLLFVGRFVPEKAPDLLVRAFRQVEGRVRLVLAGDSSFTERYARDLRERAR